MGERMDVQRSPDSPYLRARHTVMTILNMRLFKVWLQPDCLFNLTPYAKQQSDNIHLTHKFTDEVSRYMINYLISVRIKIYHDNFIGNRHFVVIVSSQIFYVMHHTNILNA